MRRRALGLAETDIHRWTGQAIPTVAPGISSASVRSWLSVRCAISASTSSPRLNRVCRLRPTAPAGGWAPDGILGAPVAVSQEKDAATRDG